MKFYIASDFDLIDKVESICKILEANGHEVPVKWWSRLDLKRKFQDMEPDAFYAEPEVENAFIRDMQGIQESDALILVAADTPRLYGGANVEVGIAIGIGRPVFSLGVLKNSAMYWYVKRCMFIDEILALAKNQPSEKETPQQR